MRFETPFRNGSVFEDGNVRRMCVGLPILGMNSTADLVRWTVESKLCPLGTVNSPHRKKPDQASLIATSKLMLSLRLRSPDSEASARRMVSVIGSLGLRTFSP